MNNTQNSTHIMGITALILLFGLLTSCNDQPTRKPLIPDHGLTTASSWETSTFEEEGDISFEKGVSCAYRDSRDYLWFGSNVEGAYCYNGKTFTHFTMEDGLPNNKVCAITEDNLGNIWFGTAKGLSRFDGKTFTTLAIPQSDTSSVWLDKVYPIVNPNQVMSILQDREGDLWIGTNGAGVYRYDGKTFTQYLSNVGMVYEDGLQHNIVLSITEDHSGDLWFTSLSHAGVSRYDGETFTHYMPEDGLSDDFVRTSYVDRAGNVWIGTHGNRDGGLDRFDGKKFTNFHKTDDGFSHNNILAIMEDQAGDLWLGSGTGAMTIFDGKHFKEFTTKEGQTFNLIFCLIEDAEGNIWFGGGGGLWRYDGENVTRL